MLKGDRETLKECFVEHVGANKTTVIATLTLGVSSGKDVETSSRRHLTTDLLQEDTLALKDGLQAEDLVRCKVNLVKQQDSTTLKCFDHRTVVPHSLTVDKTETTDEVIFVSLYSDVDTDQLTSELGTRLLDSESFAVSRKSSNKSWVENLGFNNLLKICSVAKGYIVGVLRRDE